MAKGKYGQGSLRQRGDNVWLLRYRIGPTQFAKTFRGTKKDAQKKLRELLTSGDKVEHVTPDKITLGQWIEHWISIGCPGNKRRREVGQRTKERYAELLRCHVIPTLGERPLQQLQASEIDSLYVQ